MGFGFYAAGSGLYQPTDGNLYAPRQAHGMPEFTPIMRYEGNGLRESTITGRNPQLTIDDKIPGSLEERKAGKEVEKPYLLTGNTLQYLH